VDGQAGVEKFEDSGDNRRWERGERAQCGVLIVLERGPADLEDGRVESIVKAVRRLKENVGVIDAGAEFHEFGHKR
jgi:hypothetical protein